MLNDARDTAVTTDNPTALALYEQALAQYHSYFGDPVATIDQALAEDPQFLLGHIFRATMFLVLTERRFQEEVNGSLKSADALAHRGTERERDLLKAAHEFSAGDWRAASAQYEKVLMDTPRDAFAAQSAHLLDFFRGDAVNLRDRIARILPAYDADTPSYPYLLGMYAFGLEECNEYGRAEQAARRGLALQPRDPWGIHAIAHVMEMQGRYDEGIELYRQREPDWAPDNGLAFHNWWHLAVYHIERDEHDQALQIYDTHIAPGDDAFILGMIDASAMLWRLQLQGVDVGNRWTPVAELWAQRNDNGFYAFNDVHALMAYGGAGEFAAAERLLQQMQRLAGQSGNTRSNIMMSREVGVPLGRAIVAYAKAQYHEVIEHLFPVRTRANLFGGSHAQRDVFNQTLLRAAIESRQHRLAEHLLNERFARKPDSPLTWRYAAHNLDAAGKTAHAKATWKRAADLVNRREAA